ncbi:hypothetical protein GCM10010345_16720 [Streptomyces canarius]|uniref:Uncharacterized protein n=1 Tax=Streptomyces canarius TaxID=285453 RepID=A0ABQ3CKZ3_9ACTN|nr:hypothetical protein GCM10010345_16720 [Streptomyces canarius]
MGNDACRTPAGWAMTLAPAPFGPPDTDPTDRVRNGPPVHVGRHRATLRRHRTAPPFWHGSAPPPHGTRRVRAAPEPRPRRPHVGTVFPVPENRSIM